MQILRDYLASTSSLMLADKVLKMLREQHSDCVERLAEIFREPVEEARFVVQFMNDCYALGIYQHKVTGEVTKIERVPSFLGTRLPLDSARELFLKAEENGIKNTAVMDIREAVSHAVRTLETQIAGIERTRGPVMRLQEEAGRALETDMPYPDKDK
ncbi:MAG TPA: hypothetical protein VF681_05755, partial [Abditibacteriaceae bacterium]